MFLRNWARLYSYPTPSESVFERKIALLGKPYRAQYPLFSLGRVADFALHLDKILIEIDGESHKRPAQRRKDLASTLVLEKQGWRVIRFTNEEAASVPPENLVELITHKLLTRPSLQELESDLQDLDREHPGLDATPRARKPKPGPKRAKKK